MTRLAQQILASRLVLGLSQMELASRAGFSLPTLRSLEQGRDPSDLAILALAEALAVDSDRFFALAGRLPPDLRDPIGEAPLPYRRLRSDLRLPKQGWVDRMSSQWTEAGTPGVLQFLGLGNEHGSFAVQLVSNLRRGEGERQFPRIVERSRVMDRAAAELRATGDMPPWVEEVVENVRRDLEAQADEEPHNVSKPR